MAKMITRIMGTAKKMEKVGEAFVLMALGLFIYALVFPVASNNVSAETASTEVAASIDDIIAISAPTSTSITITPDMENSTFATTSVDVVVSTNNYYGYQLSMGTSGTDSSSNLTTSLISGSSSIPSITTSISNITTSSYDDFTDNSWGFTTNNNGTSVGQIVANTYEPLTTTDSPTLIKSTDSTATADTTTVTFAVKISDEQPAGTYTNTVVFSAVANIVPQDDLLFWGSTDNSANTATTLVDKSGNDNNGTLYNFDDTTSSGWNDNELIFDGVDDYVNIGLANYDFNNSFSLIAYVKILSIDGAEQQIISNTQGNGMDLSSTINTTSWYCPNSFFSAGYNGSTYILACSSVIISTSSFYIAIATFDGATIKVYIDGELTASASTTTVTTSSEPILLGANPHNSVAEGDYANMSLREALVYDRALTAAEVEDITANFQEKWQ